MRAGLILAVALVSPLAAAQDYGLLLGLESKEEGLKTVFVHRKGVATFVKEAGDGCWLWTKDGFIHVVTEGQTDQGSRKVIVTFPGVEKSIVAAEEGRPDTFFSVLHVSTFGIGLSSSMQRANPIGAGSSGFPTRYPTVYRNMKWSSLDVAVEVGQAFDPTVAESFDRIAKEKGRMSGMVEDEAAPTNWILGHYQGEWQLYGRLLPEQNLSNQDGEMFLVGPAKDKKFGATDMGPKWIRVRTEYPDVVDLATSPNGKMTVVVTPDTVFIHESSGSTLGRKLQQIRTPSRTVVMTQWLESDEVGKAADALNKRN
jgi:hypothetical protein